MSSAEIHARQKDTLHAGYNDSRTPELIILQYTKYASRLQLEFKNYNSIL